MTGAPARRLDGGNMAEESPGGTVAAGPDDHVRLPGQLLAADDLAYLNRMTMVGHVLPNTAHELNNALQIAGGLVELLSLRTDIPEDVREKIARIGAQTARATEMIRELVGFARRDDAGAALVDVAKLVDRALAFRRYHLARARIVVSVEAVPGQVLARLDGHAVQQVVLNLVMNAEEALRGRPDARIAIRAGSGPEGVEIQVSDNGAGLGERRQRATEPFFTTHRPSAGLGLTVVAHLVRALGGTFALRDADGGGTVATVSLPAAPRAARQDAPA
jgi:two-component system C4-dicarboxylate transport sensor histidine kinase DctB